MTVYVDGGFGFNVLTDTTLVLMDRPYRGEAAAHRLVSLLRPVSE